MVQILHFSGLPALHCLKHRISSSAKREHHCEVCECINKDSLSCEFLLLVGKTCTERSNIYVGKVVYYTAKKYVYIFTGGVNGVRNSHNQELMNYTCQSSKIIWI